MLISWGMNLVSENTVYMNVIKYTWSIVLIFYFYPNVEKGYFVNWGNQAEMIVSYSCCSVALLWFILPSVLSHVLMLVLILWGEKSTVLLYLLI